LDYENYRGPMAFSAKPDQFFQMFSAALGNRIGKCRRTIDGEGDIFNFDEAKAVSAFELQI
jgi:hypothetical protein